MTDHPIKRDFDEAYNLVKGKSTDYAERENKFSNFEQAAIAAGISVEQVFLVLIGVKVARLTQLMTADKEPNFESIDDNLLDLINYPGLLRAYRRSKRATTMRDIFDAFADEELGDGWDSLAESAEPGGLIDAVLNDPINALIDATTSGWIACGDPNCCESEEGEGEQADFFDAQVDDALALMGEPPLLDEPGIEWRVGDEFQLTDQRIYTGYGAEKQVMEILASPGPYTVTSVVIDRVTFMDDNGRNLTATFDEVEPYVEGVWAEGDRFLLTDDRIFGDWRRDVEPTSRVMSSIGPYTVKRTGTNPDGDPIVHFVGMEFEDRQPYGGTWFARYTEIERV